MHTDDLALYILDCADHRGSIDTAWMSEVRVKPDSRRHRACVDTAAVQIWPDQGHADLDSRQIRRTISIRFQSSSRAARRAVGKPSARGQGRPPSASMIAR